MSAHARRRWLLLTLVLTSIFAWETALGPGSAYWGQRPINADPPASAPETRPPGALRVLYIGNSFTWYFGGQARIQTALAMSRPDWQDRPPILEQVTANGYLLRDHWELKRAQARVGEGHWDYVVLQDHSEGPLYDRAGFFHYARLFDAEARKAGAKTVLFMTWAKVHEPENQMRIAEAYETLGQELGAAVVPVGLAFAESLATRPNLILHAPDGKHPTAAGSYLAACCFDCFFHPDDYTELCATIGTPEKEWIRLNNDDARHLQEVARRVVRAKVPPVRLPAAEPAEARLRR